MADRIGGIIRIKVDGAQYNAKGAFSYRINPVKREMVEGSDEIHGFTEKPQKPYIEGSITDRSSISISDFQAITNASVTLELANGKIIVLREACYSSEGVGDTDEGEIEFRFEGISGREIRA